MRSKSYETIEGRERKPTMSLTNMNSISGGSYHIVTFDPRGVGLTTPYECPNVDTDAITGMELPLDDPAGLNATFTYNVEQGNLCSEPEYQEAGTLVGTAFVARDIDAIFQALQEDGMIRYWGFSYGTLLGSTLAAMFPEKVDRVVLDGNINPTDYYHGLGDEAVADVDAALLHFFDTCATAGPDYCALADGQSTGEELQANYYELLDGLHNNTYTTSDQTGETVTYTSAKGSVYGYLKSPSRWPSVSEDIYYLYYNAGPAARHLFTKRQSSDPPFDPLAAVDVEVPNALSAITCGDWDDIPGDINDFADWLEIYNKRSTFGGDQLISILYACSTWNVYAKEQFDGKFEGIKTNTPVLFVNSPYDPVTPLISAQNSSSGFVDSAVLQHEGAGHCSTAQPSRCVFQKVASYFETGEIPDVSETCQPDTAAFLPYEAPETIVSDNSTSTSASTGRIDDARFNAAVVNIAGLLDKRNPAFEYPAVLRDMAVKRDVYHALKHRQASASCTSMVAAATAQATSSPSGSSSSSSSNGAGQLGISVSGFALSAVAAFVVLGL